MLDTHSNQHPRIIAQQFPEKIALNFPESGIAMSYAELEAGINQCAHLFRQIGLEAGDTIAVSMRNRPLFVQLCWAALNTGVYFTPVSNLLEPNSFSYIVDNCDAKVLFCDDSLDHDKATVLAEVSGLLTVYGIESPVRNVIDLPEALANLPVTPVENEVRGDIMLYSSGTTGRPKGIKPVDVGGSIFEPHRVQQGLINLYEFDRDTVYLSTAPLYHAAPLKFVLAVTIVGGTCVVMEGFDAATSLNWIERYQVSHSQWVPTMFTRLLRLDAATRSAANCESLKYAVHAAAPCPAEIKRQMLDWWGLVIYEYYSGSEGVGMCAIGPDEWRENPGSVGKAVRGELHILDEQGEELPANEIGYIYFEGGGDFYYHKNAEGTARATSKDGWKTIGDLGYVDAAGYLYLSDRRDNLIISGGVNIYPQEIEDLLAAHPSVYDVAVFGIPCEEFGQQVKAVVRPEKQSLDKAQLEQVLLEYCHENLASFKCPKSVSFVKKLPRQPNGKLLKRLLVEQYSQGVS